MKIVGVSHPIPTEYAKRIYEENKTVYIGRRALKRAPIGSKFVIYESYGAKAFTGMGDIKFIGLMSPKDIIKKYKDKMIVTIDEFNQYSKGEKQMNVIEFEKFEKFKTPVKPKNFITPAGKYIDNKQLNIIIENKD